MKTAYQVLLALVPLLSSLANAAQVKTCANFDGHWQGSCQPVKEDMKTPLPGSASKLELTLHQAQGDCAKIAVVEAWTSDHKEIAVDLEPGKIKTATTKNALGESVATYNATWGDETQLMFSKSETRNETSTEISGMTNYLRVLSYQGDDLKVADAGAVYLYPLNGIVAAIPYRVSCILKKVP